MNSFKIIFDRDTWQEIFGSIQKNKVRTIITIIGVLWGIFIYITLSGAAKGLDNGFERAFENVAMNSLFVWAQSTSVPYDGFKIGRRPTLKIQDVDLLRKRVPEIKYIVPRNSRGSFSGGSPANIVRGTNSGNYAIYGDFPEFRKISTQQIYDGGRFINEEDIKNNRKVCVIGERTFTDLFESNENAIGEYIRIDNVYFKVIGILVFRQGSPFDSDSDVFIPFTTFKTLYNTGDEVGWFNIAAYENADVIKVEEDIKQTLKMIHRVSPIDKRAFGSFNLGEVFNNIIGFARGMTFLSLIVGIATIIAGVIGIGNILLISVKERTRELGVRRALGATPGEVRAQIILESVFLTVVAGILGIILGAFVLATINYFTVDLKDFPYTNPTVPISFVIGALLIMVTLGTLIGLIPAQRAVSIKPIDALREE
ncbi:MAG: multidrug ABC transporter ATP-binding protein [Flavobacteriaceae bacterium]|nr:multidrug ABC transporter ATP-binding protein [Flavobacteriaceae bacterium]|tara:strand:+ start:25757 stop:27034 length:1278 start_codon:yes stop_codon:yes gene_type:complete